MRDRRALTASLANAQKFYFYTIREPAFRLPAIMLQPSISLDFRRQRHHVKLSTLMWMLTFWPRDERFAVPFLACNLIPSIAQATRGVASKFRCRRAGFPGSCPAQRKTNN